MPNFVVQETFSSYGLQSVGMEQDEGRSDLESLRVLRVQRCLRLSGFTEGKSGNEPIGRLALLPRVQLWGGMPVIERKQCS